MQRLFICILFLAATVPAAVATAEQDYGPGFWDSEIDTTLEDSLGGETNHTLPTPDQIKTIERRNLLLKISPMISFPQTQWNECRDRVTGNYSTAACAAERRISVILDDYLQNRLIDCVDVGMSAQGGGTAERVHITHAGVTADINHSPRSLHSYNRAIDVKVIKVDLTNDTNRQFTYSIAGNRPFYKALRQCWGKVVHEQNGCPYYSGNPQLTGSIGWENRDHGRHMHLSVPYCVNGQYGSGIWRR